MSKLRMLGLVGTFLPMMGCFPSLPSQGGPTSWASQQSALLSADDRHGDGQELLFGAVWIGGSSIDSTVDGIKKNSPLKRIIPLLSFANPRGADILVRLTYQYSPVGIRIEATSAKSGRLLYEGTAPWQTKSGGYKSIGEQLSSAFALGTDLYGLVSAEKRGAVKAEGESQGIGQIRAAPSSSVDQPSYKLAERQNAYAVVIGVEQYSDIPPALFAERDAAAMRRHLAALGVPERNMISLVGSKAGKASFIKTLETWLPSVVGKDSDVFIYYSGHGAPDPVTGQAYLLPWDGDPQFLNDTAYPIKRLYAKLSELKAKRVLVMLDSCFSGAGGRSVIARGLRPLVNKVDVGSIGGRVVALSASGANEVSGTSDEQGHGLFTFHLLNTLNRASDNNLNVRAMFDAATPKVQDDARRQNRAQSPQLRSGEVDPATWTLR